MTSPFKRREAERAEAARRAEAEAATKTPADLAFDLEAVADDLADQAGDYLYTDDALPTLALEAACRRAAALLRASELNNPTQPPPI